MSTMTENPKFSSWLASDEAHKQSLVMNDNEQLADAIAFHAKRYGWDATRKIFEGAAGNEMGRKAAVLIGVMA